VYDTQQLPTIIHSNYCISPFVLATGVRNTQKGVEENFAPMLKGDAVFPLVRSRLVGIPDEGNTLKGKGTIHNPIVKRRPYNVNTMRKGS